MERYKNFGNLNKDVEDIVNLIVDDENRANWREIGSMDGKVSKFAEKLGKDLNTTQLRKFFDEFVSIENKIKEEKCVVLEMELYKIMPMLVYAKGRKLCPDKFVSFIKESINRILEGNDNNIKIKRFEIFMRILESIVAYNKYYEVKHGR